MGEQLPEPSLSALVHLLAEQALLALGVPHPQLAHQPPANPQVGRFYVELLGVLKAKTEGHRTDAETLEIEAISQQLRMRAMNILPAAPAEGPRV